MVNNKNIKHAANPKGRGNEETVESGGLQKKKKRKEKERNEGDIILVLAGKYSEIGEEGGGGRAVDLVEGSI